MKYLSPVKAIKKFCYECSGNSTRERNLCSIEDCVLYPYRLGKNPNRIGKRYSKNPPVEYIMGRRVIESPSKIQNERKNHHLGGGFLSAKLKDIEP